MFQITEDPIDPAIASEFVRDPNCGANLIFFGTTRERTGDRQTELLEYQGYDPMAVKELERVAGEAKEKWPVKKIAIIHRVGLVGVGEISIVVAVSGPHRSETFAAGEWLMHEIKSRVPIWKKESWTDGRSEWQHPTDKIPTEFQ